MASEPATLGEQVAVRDNPVAIRAAALQLFWERGYHGTSVRQISRAADTAVANVYHYFPRKLDILYEIIDGAQTALQRSTQSAIEQAAEDPVSQLVAVVSAHVRFHVEYQRESFIGNSEMRSLPPSMVRRYIDKRDTQQAMFERPIDAGIETGVFRVPHPREAVLGMVTMCTSVALWYRPDGDFTPDEVVEHFTQLALQMVGVDIESAASPAQ
jgi:AcrR family transcriptional regulator